MSKLEETITFNIFSNCCVSTPNAFLIDMLLKSIEVAFKITLNDIVINVFIDHHPHSDRFDAYVENIKTVLCNHNVKNFSINRTEGLSYSHAESIKLTKTPILFELEHDHTFNTNIKHSLMDLCNVLLNNNEVECIQFGRLKKNNATQHFGLTQVIVDNIPFCKTKYISNIPYLIKMENAMERIKHVKFVKASWKGIEYELTQTNLFLNHLYGKINYPATITHSDGMHATNI